MTAQRIETALNDFVNNEDYDEGNEKLRNAITNLKELRFALSIAKQSHWGDYDDILDILISID